MSEHSTEFTTFIDICVVNICRLYGITYSQKHTSLLDVLACIYKTTSSAPKRPNQQTSKLQDKRVRLDVRFDDTGHLFVPIKIQRRSALFGEIYKKSLL